MRHNDNSGNKNAKYSTTTSHAASTSLTGYDVIMTSRKMPFTENKH